MGKESLKALETLKLDLALFLVVYILYVMSDLKGSIIKSSSSPREYRICFYCGILCLVINCDTFDFIFHWCRTYYFPLETKYSIFVL